MNIIAPPNIKLAKQLFSEISRRLWNSFDHLLQSGGFTNCNFAYLVEQLRHTTKAPPFFFAAHHIILNSCTGRQFFDESLKLEILDLDYCQQYSNLTILPFLKSPDLQEQSCQEVIFSDIRETYSTDQFLPTAFESSHECNPTKLTIKHALNIIKISAPDLYCEIEFLIDEIRIFSSGNIRAGSNFNTLGLIYIGCQTQEDSVSRYIEHIVHEAAHNLLYAHWVIDPLFTNHSDQLYYTPFRNDKRPLSAIFHAMFVLARTIYIFDKIYHHSPNSLDFNNIKTNYNESGNSESFKTKFLQTAKVVSTNAKFTSHGKQIFDDCLQMVKNCSLEI